MRQFSPKDSTRFSFPASRFTTLGLRCSSSSTCTRWGALRARSLSAPFRIPHSALGFKVDQRVAPLGEAGPWLHLDDVIQHGPSDAERDLPGGALERAPPPGARRGARIAREQLQLRGARNEGGELDDESLHRSGGRRPLELRLERRRDALSRRGRILEGRGYEPGGPMLELGAQSHYLHAPAATARIRDRAVDELVQCVGEQVPLADWGEKREGGHDRLWYDPSDHRLRFECRREPPQPPAGAAELRHDGFFRQRDERAQRLDAELPQPAMRVGVEREHGEPLGREELRLPSHGHEYHLSGFRTRGCHPGNKLSSTPPNAEFRMRSAEFQGRVIRLTTFTLIFRIPYSAFRTPHLYGFDDLLRPSVQSFQSVGAHERPPQLHRLDHRAHGAERRHELDR